MEIEEQIFDQTSPASVDRTEVLGWLERERTRMQRKSMLTFAGIALVLGCALCLVYQLLESEANQVRRLVGTPPSSHTLMLEELTHELCGAEPAEYWIQQIGLIGSNDSSRIF